MKYSSGFILSIVVLALVILLAIHLAGRGFVPYQDNNIYSTNSFEGFNKMPDHLSYGTYPGNKTIDQQVTHNLVQAPVQGPQPVWGLGGLFSQPNAQGSILDIFSDAKGSLASDCQTTSSGLMNSKGALCLNKQQLQMLTTRGGNQSGCASQVGMCGSM